MEKHGKYLERTWNNLEKCKNGKIETFGKMEKKGTLNNGTFWKHGKNGKMKNGKMEKIIPTPLWPLCPIHCPPVGRDAVGTPRLFLIFDH